MAFVIKMILLFLLVLFLITVVRIAFSVLRLLSLPADKQARQRQEHYDDHRRQGPPRTIELDKDDYKVE